MSEFSPVPPLPPVAQPLAAPVPPTANNARATALQRLSDCPWDVLVIGGGITGAGIALDAASRGLKVALVERDDLASGTSSRSSSLIHGGLRYLEQFGIGLMRESAVERERLRRLAPHLVEPLAFTVPWSGRRRTRMIGVGLWLYDAIAAYQGPSRHRRLTTDEVVQRMPGLTAHLDGHGYEYSDCRTDDVRLVLAVIKAAERFGATVLTQAEVTELRTVSGRVVGATVRDRASGRELTAEATCTVSATGIWADSLRGMAGLGAPVLQPSKGVHLVFPASALRVLTAGVLPSLAGDGRSVFLIPWDNQVVVGTTDDAYEGSLDSPGVTPADASYLCTAVNAAFGTRLSAADAVGAYAGLRPLLQGESDQKVGTDQLSRRHSMVMQPEGLLTVTGGKLTTYRAMAAQAVDMLTAALGGSAARKQSVTKRITLGLGGSVNDAVARTQTLCSKFDLDPALAAALVRRHGDAASAVLEMAVKHGEAAPLVDGLDYLVAEARWAIEHEHARSVSGVLQRRMKVARRDPAAGVSAANTVADLLASAHGWTAAQRQASIAEHFAQVRAERGPVPMAGAPASSVL